VSVEREGDIQTSAGCGGTGHSTQQAPPVDCGVRNGTLHLRPGFFLNSQFRVSGEYNGFAPAGQPAPKHGGQALGLTYENCDWLPPSSLEAAHDELTPLTAT